MLEEKIIQKQGYTISEAIVANKFGIHARPSALIIKKSSEYAKEVYIKIAGREEGYCGVNSLTRLMSLNAKLDDKILIKVEGTDAKAKQFCGELSAFISADEDEMPKLFKQEMGIDWSTYHENEKKLSTKIIRKLFCIFDYFRKP